MLAYWKDLFIDFSIVIVVDSYVLIVALIQCGVGDVRIR